MQVEQVLSLIFPDYGLLGNSTHCRGEPYQQLFGQYPALESSYFTFEKSYDANPGLKVLQNLTTTTPLLIVLLYVILSYIGEKVMQNRMELNIPAARACWNASLAMFSFYGAIRTVPHLINRLCTVSFEESVCEAPCTAFGSGAAGLATQLFILSKIPELFDTAFIVMRKKPVTFLHRYHHITVLLYCWNSYVTESSTGLYFVAMNCTVHTLMYSYYCLQSLGMLPTWFPAYAVTATQILQMVVGALIVLASAYFHTMGGAKYPPGTCNDHPSNIIAGFVMYGSYLYLFVKFAVRRFKYLNSKSH